MPWDAGTPRPGRNPAIARIGPAIAGFRMAPQRRDAMGTVDPGQDLGRIAGNDAQGLAKRGKRALKLRQAFGSK